MMGLNQAFRPPRAAALPLLLLAAACEQGEAVEVSAAPAPACSVAPVATSAADAEFSRISALDADGAGRMYVADAGALQIVVLGADGSVIGHRGRAGQGPGEFGDLSSVQVVDGDSVAVLDRQHNRLTVFAPDAAAPPRTVSLSQASAHPPPFAAVQTRDGNWLAEYRQYYRGDDDPAADALRKRIFRLLRPDGVPLRDVVELPEPETHVIVRKNGIVMSAPNPFGHTGPWALGPDDQLVYGWGDSLSVRIYSLAGRGASGFARPHPAARLTPGDLDKVVQAEPEAFRAALREQAPPSWPAFRQLRSDDAGNVWVGAVAPPGEPTLWHVFRPDGTLLCTAPLPGNARVERIRNGLVYAVDADENDVPRVIVYRMSQPQGGQTR